MISLHRDTTPWERALECEPSRERMSTYRRSDTGGEGPTRDRPTQRAPTQRAPDTQRERPTQGGATHTGDTQTTTISCAGTRTETRPHAAMVNPWSYPR